MKAAVVHSWGDADQLSVETVPDPTPNDGEVLVELRASSLNWHDVILRQTGRGFTTPSILGMDGAGTRLDTGDDTIIYPCLNWGSAETAPGKDFAILGDSTDGTYADLVSVPVDNLFPKPEHLSWEEAAALPCAGLTAYRAMFTRADLQEGETVLVLGAGSGVSTFAVTFGAAAGAHVLVTSSSIDKIESVRAIGAERGFLYTDPDWVEQVVEATGGGVDVVISGTGANLAEALGCLKPGGRIAVFGSSAGRTATFEVPSLYFGQFTILGTTLGSPTDFGQMLQFVEKHQIRPVIDSTWALDDIVAAHQHLESRRHLGKIVLVNKAE
ncbi:zinc-binding alcohol dehydrogenase family protein [Rhodococcus sp. NPDC127530]|uniref:quinone oxidoreductase family protein n=1 Tax=unclassified Rhodococcus (in: high G+C Gram-positive bacteria) TaxID=192944 RepID=UPI00121A06C8|nr:MAG: oxidoreductase [Rhodococcus sp. (in: high G+C Gram-positive bacteria)]